MARINNSITNSAYNKLNGWTDEEGTLKIAAKAIIGNSELDKAIVKVATAGTWLLQKFGTELGFALPSHEELETKSNPGTFTVMVIGEDNTESKTMSIDMNKVLKDREYIDAISHDPDGEDFLQHLIYQVLGLDNLVGLEIGAFQREMLEALRKEVK